MQRWSRDLLSVHLGMDLFWVSVFICGVCVRKSAYVIFLSWSWHVNCLSFILRLTTVLWVNAELLWFGLLVINKRKSWATCSLVLIISLKLCHVSFIQPILSVFGWVSLIHLLAMNVSLVKLITIHLHFLSSTVRTLFFRMRLMPFRLFNYMVVIVKIINLPLYVEHIVASCSWQTILLVRICLTTTSFIPLSIVVVNMFYLMLIWLLAIWSPEPLQSLVTFFMLVEFAIFGIHQKRIFGLIQCRHFRIRAVLLRIDRSTF